MNPADKYTVVALCIYFAILIAIAILVAVITKKYND